MPGLNPYSILTQNSQNDYMKESSMIEEVTGARTTRANALRQLHNKKQYEASIDNQRMVKAMQKSQQQHDQ